MTRAGSRARATMRMALCVACACAWSCTASEPSRKEPAAETASRTVSKVKSEASTPTSATVGRRAQAQGRWCLRSIGDEERSVLDGSIWLLNADGTYSWQSAITTSGVWSLSDDKLTLSHAGEHTIIELDADHMVLERMLTQFNLFRECGPELEAARRVEPLRKAAANGDLLMVKALLDQGADVNGVDRLHALEHTPLIAAIHGGHVDVVKQLLARGASVTVLTGLDETAFEHARKNEPDEMTPLLIAKLRRPASLSEPAYTKKAKGTSCPESYVAITDVCVHTYALPRAELQKEIWAFDGDSPALIDWELEPPIASAAQQHDSVDHVGKLNVDVNDLSALDPGALMRPGGDPVPEKASSRYGSSSGSGYTRRVSSSRPSRRVDWDDDDSSGEAASSDSARDETKRSMCAQYRPALERMRAEGLSDDAKAWGLTQESAIRAVEANIRTCESWGY